MGELVTTRNEMERLDLADLLRLLWVRRWWIVITMVVVTVIAAMVAFLTTPIYRATVVLAPADPEGIADSLSSRLGDLGGLVSLAGVDLGSSTAGIDISLAVLRSRQFTEEFVLAQGMMPKLFPDTWDATKNTWKDPENRTSARWRAFRYFDSKVRTITQDRRTGFVTLQIDWRDSVEAAEWANAMAKFLNDEMRARAAREADASIGFLEEELQRTTTVATREAISRLIESQIKKRMLTNVLPEYAFRIIDRAIPADPTAPLRPQKLWLLGGGVLGGFGLGVFLVVIAGSFRSHKRESKTQSAPQS
jgi:uncharacterized protein involved in exopolysaccharide biosynthesis